MTLFCDDKRSIKCKRKVIENKRQRNRKKYKRSWGTRVGEKEGKYEKGLREKEALIRMKL